MDFARGVPEAIDCCHRADHVFLPFVTLAELRAGFRAGSQNEKNEALLARFVNTPRVTVLLPDQQTTHVYAEISVQLRRAGRPIPTNDIWIAALVIQHGLILFSRDKHFDAVPQIPRL